MKAGKNLAEGIDTNEDDYFEYLSNKFFVNSYYVFLVTTQAVTSIVISLKNKSGNMSN